MISFHRALNPLLRRLFTGSFAKTECTHLELINDVEPSADVCVQCVELGDTWPALRMCLICGHVGCCEDGNRHAEQHWKETGHPLMRPHRSKSMDWIWCYEDQALLEPQ